MNRRVAMGALLAMSLCAPAASNAQSWSLDAQGGRLRFDADPDAAAATTFVLGVRRTGQGSSFGVTAGLPTNTGDPLWAALSGWKRIAAGNGTLSAGIDLAGQAFGLRYDRPSGGGLPVPFPGDASTGTGYGVSARVLPMLAFATYPVRAELRAGVAHYSRDIEDPVIRSRTLPMGEVALSVAPRSAFMLSGNLTSWVDGADTWSMAQITVWLMPAEPIALWASAGHWLAAPADDAVPLEAGLRLALTNRLALTGSARRAAFDPVLDTPSRTAWSAGLSLRFGGATPRAPVPDSYADGTATILLPASEAGATPSIAGDFNGWTPQPMTRRGKHWSFDVAVEPGVYNYSFVSADGRWFVPESVPGRRDDGMGGHVAVLVVQ